MNQTQINWDPSSRKHGGDPQSIAAHARATVFKRQAYAQILAYLGVADSAGLTSKELAKYLGTGMNCFSGRLTELRRNGLIAHNGIVREGAKVLVITEKGRAW